MFCFRINNFFFVDKNFNYQSSYLFLFFRLLYSTFSLYQNKLKNKNMNDRKDIKKKIIESIFNILPLFLSLNNSSQISQFRPWYVEDNHSQYDPTDAPWWCDELQDLENGWVIYYGVVFSSDSSDIKYDWWYIIELISNVAIRRVREGIWEVTLYTYVYYKRHASRKEKKSFSVVILSFFICKKKKKQPEIGRWILNVLLYTL